MSIKAVTTQPASVPEETMAENPDLPQNHLDDVESLLRDIEANRRLPEQAAEDCAAFVRAIHERWVANGGPLDGKPRNSVRQLSELLKASKKQIKSLTPKLRGRTRLKKPDVASLLEVWFANWTFPGKSGGNAFGYDKFAAEDVEFIRDTIITALFGSQERALLPPQPRASAPMEREDLPEDKDFKVGRDVILDNFRVSNALIIISRTGTIVGPTTASSIKAFYSIIEALWKIELEEPLERNLIWLVDPGDDDLEDDDSLAAMANAEQLATYFRVIGRSKDSGALELWNWFIEHAVIILGSQVKSKIEDIYNSHESKQCNVDWEKFSTYNNIKHNHFLLGDDIPLTWASGSDLERLYGETLEHFESSSFILFLNREMMNWRYYGYAPSDHDLVAKDGVLSFTKSLELETPSKQHDLAASIFYHAACYRLENPACEISQSNGKKAIATLLRLGFAALKIPEFLTLNRTL